MMNQFAVFTLLYSYKHVAIKFGAQYLMHVSTKHIRRHIFSKMQPSYVPTLHENAISNTQCVCFKMSKPPQVNKTLADMDKDQLVKTFLFAHTYTHTKLSALYGPLKCR